MSKFQKYSRACALAVLSASAAAAQPAHPAALQPAHQHLNILGNFKGANGAKPWSTLVLASDGNFYGTTQNGGTNPLCTVSGGCGTIFKVTPSGKLTSLYSFAGTTDGGNTFAGLVQGANGNLYGVTPGEPPYTTNYGTAFEITLGGQFTILHQFQGPEGALPNGTLMLSSDGNFYGTAQEGGNGGGGTIFSMTPTGTLKTLWSFDYADFGFFPYSSLIQTKSGDLYGTTAGGTAYSLGGVFKLSAHGHFTVIHAFKGLYGGVDVSGLLLGADGNFYGTTENGGKYVGYGNVFKMTPTGKMTILHSFDVTDGDVPVGLLIQGMDGNFYGTTAYGGPLDEGTVFKITPAGKLTTLYAFGGDTYKFGGNVYAGLVQAPNGLLYGDTFLGGSAVNPACPYGCGLVFSLSPGPN